MIIVNLKGGLGNQMFQYAIAKKIAMKHKTEVVFDLSSYENNPLRKYDLMHFYINVKFAGSIDLVLFGLRNSNSIVNFYYKILRRIIQPKIIYEKQFHFDLTVFEIAKKNTYLEGYWQTEKYFSDVRPVLLNDFQIKKPLEGKNLKFANIINVVNSVSLHIRRGDYVSNAETLDIHGLCGLDYYSNAIEYICFKEKKPILFIFSDDMQWVKENLKTSIKTFFVDVNNSETSYEDLRLMSLCKHNIIANSSFSWWGAWLNKNPDKIVIAPNKWFISEKFNCIDIVPESWIKL